MAKQKRIRCFGHGPIFTGPQYKSPWEDVWLRWKGKPGRAVYHAAPCLQCSAEIQPELDLHQQIRDRDDDVLDGVLAEDWEKTGEDFAMVGNDLRAVADFGEPQVITRTFRQVFDLPKTTKKERASWYLEDDARMRAALKVLETQPYYVDPPWPGQDKHLETVYTNAKGIDRAEAERMLAFYLAEVFGVKNPKFVWDRPEIIIMPTGFGNYD